MCSTNECGRISRSCLTMKRLGINSLLLSVVRGHSVMQGTKDVFMSIGMFQGWFSMQERLALKTHLFAETQSCRSGHQL